MANEIINEKKIEALERIVKAIFGRQSKEITYRQNCEDMIEVRLECDLDDAIKNLSSLHCASIETDFYTGERQLQEACSFAYIGVMVNHFIGHDKIVFMPTQNPHINRMELTLRGHITTLNIDKFLQEHVFSAKEYATWNAHQWEEWLPVQNISQDGGK